MKLHFSEGYYVPTKQEQPTATFVGNDRFELSPGRFVERGEKLRISGGPTYTDSTGVTHRIGEHGVFTFIMHAYDRCGGYLLVSGDSGATVVIPLGKRKSKLGLPGWKHRPYKIVKLKARA